MALTMGDVSIRRRPTPLREDVYKYSWGSVTHRLDWESVKVRAEVPLGVDDLDELIGILQVIRQEILTGGEER